MLELLAAPVHEDGGQCFARFVPPLYSRHFQSGGRLDDATLRRIEEEHAERYIWRVRGPDALGVENRDTLCRMMGICGGLPG